MRSLTPIRKSVQPRETAAMQITVEKVIVARHDPARRELTDFFRAESEQLGRAVENCRWPVNVEEIAGKHIAAEKQVMPFAEKPAVAECMARQVNHTQAAPEREQLAVSQRRVNRRSAITENRTASKFQSPAPLVHALIRIAAVNVLLLQRMRINLRAGPRFERSEIPGVIKMPVCEKNRLNRLGSQAKTAHEPANQKHFSEQTGINHYAGIAVFEKEAATHRAADAVKCWRNIAHACLVTGIPVAG